jgi:Ca2+-binding EF-hand superfamily protein
MTMRFLLPLLCASGLVLAQGGIGDPWERIRRYDTDGDGRISREEFTGPERSFNRFDTDRDGFVTETEVRRLRGGRQGRLGPAAGAVRLFDTDGDGRVTAEEWEAFFATADRNEDGVLQAAELSAAMSGRARKDDAPKLGDKAPKVKAKSLKEGRYVDLSKPKRTTVLVFGSWT